jgi:SAM-dependent methyltransferase
MMPVETGFDCIASNYDSTFTERRVARWYRTVVQGCIAEHFGPGDLVLDLGCGTGEDALWAARRGARVHAVDVSPEMLNVAREKIGASPLGRAISLFELDLRSAGRKTVPFNHLHDACFSNFGAINCIEDRTALARALAGCLRWRGRLVLVVMGPLCPWEWFYYGARARPQTAVRRLRGMALADVGGAPVSTWYPSPARIRSEFWPWFQPVSLRGIGTVVPPVLDDRFYQRRPKLAAWLENTDLWLGRHLPGTWLNDHYVITFERTRSANG